MSKNPTTRKGQNRFRAMVASDSVKNGLLSVSVLQYTSLRRTLFATNPIATPGSMGFSDTL